ncbi:MAG: S1C family serine protease, partial [Planctomycetota bacterium]
MRRVATFTVLLLGALVLTACAGTSGRASTGDRANSTSAVKSALRCTVSLVVETDGGDSFGTGIIFDNSGHVITVHHVVEDANRIVVLASGGQTSNAVIVGADPIADLALLKIESGLPEGLSPAKLAKFEPRAGQNIWSVGNPFGTSRYGGEPSVSSGVI